MVVGKCVVLCLVGRSDKCAREDEDWEGSCGGS